MLWRSSFTNQDKFLCQPMHSFENTHLHLCSKMLSQQHLISFLFLRRLSQDLVVFLWDESRHLRYKNAYYLLCLVVSSTVSSFYFFFVFWPLVYLFLCFTCIFSNRKRWLVRIETLQRQISSPLFIIIWLTSTCPNGSLSQCWMPFLHVTSVELFWTPFVTLNFSLIQIVCLNEIGNYMYF